MQRESNKPPKIDRVVAPIEHFEHMLYILSIKFNECDFKSGNWKFWTNHITMDI